MLTVTDADQGHVSKDATTTTSRVGALLSSVVAASIATAALAAPAAFAADRYVAPAAGTSGDCTLTPCQLDRALAVAQPGDAVLLADGTYPITYRVTSAAAGIEIRPETPGTRPRLIGDAGLAFPTVELTGAGATVKGLQIETTGRSAVRLAGGARGDGLILLAGGTNAVGATLASDPARTALVNSLAHTTSSFTAIDVVDGASPGHVSMVNVTAIATGTSSWGVTTDLGAQSPVLKNSIVRATAKSLHGRSGTQPILVSNSNFVSSGAANWSDVSSNQRDVAVTFAGPGDYRVAPGAPTIDRGAADSLITGTFDPDGKARRLHSAPDIGAYESDTAGAPVDSGTVAPVVTDDRGTEEQPGNVTPGETPAGGTGQPAGTGLPLLPPAAPPVLAERVGVDTTSGEARVRLPGTDTFVPLSAAASIPVGSTIDARKGHVTVTSVRDAAGNAQTGEFWGGVFVVRQAAAKKPYTELVLRGGSFRTCPARSASRTVARASRSGKMRSVVRKLWGKDKAGRFRTRGKRAAATVRGTTWLVADRCDGTLTRVLEGAVSVRNRRTGKTKLVKAGEKHLVRAPKRRARR